jgi:hypothetical protein
MHITFLICNALPDSSVPSGFLPRSGDGAVLSILASYRGRINHQKQPNSCRMKWNSRVVYNGPTVGGDAPSRRLRDGAVRPARRHVDHTTVHRGVPGQRHMRDSP